MSSFRHFLPVLMAVLALGTSAATAAESLVKDIEPYVFPKNKPSQPAELTFMPDGRGYASVSPDGRRIVVTDIASAQESVIFDVANTRQTTIAGIKGFTLSADAGKILVWNSTKAIYRRSFQAEYYVYDCHSRILSPLSATHHPQQIPAFSPDGRMVAFVHANNVYVAKLDYGTEVAVTTDGKPGSIINGATDWTYEEEFTLTSSLAWAPDNLTLCYLRFDEQEVPMYSFPLYEGTCDPLTEYALYPGQFTYKYPVAGQPNSRVSLHSYDIETRKIKDLALPDRNIEYIPRISYGPTPEALLAVTLNRDQNRMEIYSVNPKSTVARSVYVAESKAWIAPEAYENITFGPDCFTVLSDRTGYSHAYQYSYAGAEIRTLTSGAYDVTEYYGTDAQGNHYVQIAYPTPLDRTVRRIDRKGVATDVAYSEGTTSALFAPGMAHAMICHSDAQTPPVYTLSTAAGKTLRVLCDNAGYTSVLASLPRKEFFTMQSAGLQLNGFMVKPADFNPSRRYPVVMYQYSGPGSQTVLNRWELDWYQFFATRGYIVICVDGRGTGGRGREFSDVVYRCLGLYETEDQLAAARYAASLPYVDPSRIGIFGWSYGGYETLMAISAPGAPYAAAVAVAPVTDWRFYDTVYTERYMLTPQQNFDGYNKASALARTRTVACPLLLMHGTADDNVHLANTLQYVSRMESAGMMPDMLLFPNMNHSINHCNARAVVYARMLSYFDSHLK